MWGRPAALAPFRPNFNAYGLGWMLRDYRGRKLVAHTGTLAGFVSRTTMLPELGLGMVVLANQEETDWVAAFREMARVEAAKGEATVRKASGRNAASKPSLPPTRSSPFISAPMAPSRTSKWLPSRF